MVWEVIFMTVAGLSEGVMDYLQFRYDGESKFWNPELSWVNKWKDRDPRKGERFFLSSTALVFLTDGWHLMKWVRNRSIDCVLFSFGGIWFLLIARAFYYLAFNLFFNKWNGFLK